MNSRILVHGLCLHLIQHILIFTNTLSLIFSVKVLYSQEVHFSSKYPEGDFILTALHRSQGNGLGTAFLSGDCPQAIDLQRNTVLYLTKHIKRV